MEQNSTQEEQFVEISDSQQSSSTTSTTTITPASTTLSSTTPSPTPGECLAESGPASGRPCVFPFTYSGKTYSTCTPWIFGGEMQGKLWCSTKTDIHGFHLNGEGEYGFCSPDCGPNNTPLTGADARKSSAKDAVVFREELPVILEYPK